MISLSSRSIKYLSLNILRHDLKASITVFFVALPLCLGISLASGAPIYSGLIAGMIGGIVVPMISRSSLSVSGPAAGLTAICATAIVDLGNIQLFFLSVSVAGMLQVALGMLRLGAFTHFIPSSVIKGMLAAIGVILISKQIPILIGYDKPDFWRDELFNIFTFRHGFDQITDLYQNVSIGAFAVATISLAFLILWKLKLAHHFTVLPASFLTVLVGTLAALALESFSTDLGLKPAQFVAIPSNIFKDWSLPDLSGTLLSANIWETGLLICVVASLETLLSIEAVDKLDPLKRITPQNRELVAQGVGNVAAGLAGGIPITSVIVRGSANAEAGARSRVSAILHGAWLLVAVLLLPTIINHIPYAVLAVILIRTGYNLAKPKMILGIYRQGREQFLPFAVTVVAILFTDLLIGVVIGIGYAIYFLIKHTYRAGYKFKQWQEGHTMHYKIDLALNVSFLNKRRFTELLDSLPNYSVVEIDGSNSVYIDHDVLEIFHNYKTKAHSRHIQLELKGIPEVDILEIH